MRHKLCMISLFCFVSLIWSGCASQMKIDPRWQRVESQRKKAASLIKKLEFSKIYYDRIYAATQLGDIGPVASDAVPALVRALRDKYVSEYGSVRKTATTALRKIGTPEAMMAVKQYQAGLLSWGDNPPVPYRIVRDTNGNVLDDYGTVISEEEIKANMRVGYRTGCILGVVGIGFLIGKFGELADSGQPAELSQPADFMGPVTLIGAVVG